MIIFRIISTASHSIEDVDYTLNAFKEIRKKLQDGVYDTKEMKDVTIK